MYLSNNCKRSRTSYTVLRNEFERGTTGEEDARRARKEKAIRDAEMRKKAGKKGEDNSEIYDTMISRIEKTKTKIREEKRKARALIIMIDIKTYNEPLRHVEVERLSEVYSRIRMLKARKDALREKAAAFYSDWMQEAEKYQFYLETHQR